MSAHRVPLPGVALAYHGGEDEPDTAVERVPGLQVLPDDLNRNVKSKVTSSLLGAGLGLQIGDEGEDCGADCEGDEDKDPESWSERPDQGKEFRFQFRIGSHEDHVVNVKRDRPVQHLSSSKKVRMISNMWGVTT